MNADRGLPAREDGNSAVAAGAMGGSTGETGSGDTRLDHTVAALAMADRLDARAMEEDAQNATPEQLRALIQTLDAKIRRLQEIKIILWGVWYDKSHD